ncbi:MAG: hypothetical protein SFV54_11725 [Bryobacteraceae bacterium]|nr:hypothetical protein [Bryobacteraceae bacterium]
MFDSLDETIKHDAEVQSTRKERLLRYLMVAAVSVLVFGGLFAGVSLMSGD